MKESTKVSFAWTDIEVKSRDIDLNLDSQIHDTYAVVTPVKNIVLAEEK